MRAAQRFLRTLEGNAGRLLLEDARSGRRLTYDGFLGHSLALAAVLRDRGLAPGGFAVCCLENRPELAVAYMAAWHAGAVVVPLHAAMHPREIGAVLGRLADPLLITDAAGLARLGDAGAIGPACRTLRLAAAAADDGFFLDLQAEPDPPGAPERTVADTGDDETALVAFTSGSSGRPRGVRIRIGAMLGNALAFGGVTGIDRDTRSYDTLPMTALGGLYNLMLLPMVHGGSLVLDDPFDARSPAHFWERARRFGVNSLWLNPTMLSMLLSRPDEGDAAFARKEIRLACCGMAPLSPELKRRFEDRFGFSVLESYGLSETLFVTVVRPGAPAKPGSQGLPLPGVELVVADAAGTPQPAGVTGEICIRTPFLMAGMLGEGETRPGPNGFATGDLGSLDADGELFVSGRLKDVIIRGGTLISPTVIEEAAHGLDMVEEAAAVGLPHPILGEEIALAVSLRPGHVLALDALRDHLEANLAPRDRPRHLFFIDAMPRGLTGKVLKNVLRRLLVEKLAPFGS
mgnify:CR=1 FL=1